MTKFLAVLAFVLLLASAAAEEEAQSYDVAVVVAPDGSAEVTETIAVNVEGKEIKRGIFHSLAKNLIGDDGSILQPEIEVISATRDGEPEKFVVEETPSHVNVRIGDAGVLLEHRVHTFILGYRLSQLAKVWDGRNNLSFEPIGRWQFPIKAASVRVTLPAGAFVMNAKARVGTLKDPEAGDWKGISRTEVVFTPKVQVGGLHTLNLTITFNGGLLPGRGLPQ